MKNIIGGGVVYWTLASHTNRERLLSAWNTLGFAELVPDPQDEVACLRDALKEVVGGSRVLVRPLQKKNGFAVTREGRGEDENQYDNWFSVKVPDAVTGPVFSGGLEWEVREKIVELYERSRGRLPAAKMSSAMVALMYKLGGTALRPTGGIYWVDQTRLDDYRAATRAAENAAENGTTIAYCIEHTLDKDSIKAIHDAISYEVTTEVTRLTDLIQSGDLGDRAIRARKAEAAALKEKVAQYEEIIGVSLRKLTERLEEVEQQRAIVTILASTLPQEETANGLQPV